MENLGPGISLKFPTGVPITTTPDAIASNAGSGPVSDSPFGIDVTNNISIVEYHSFTSSGVRRTQSFTFSDETFEET